MEEESVGDGDAQSVSELKRSVKCTLVLVLIDEGYASDRNETDEVPANVLVLASRW